MICVIKGQFNGMIGTIIQEIQPQIYLIQFGDRHYWYRRKKEHAGGAF